MGWELIKWEGQRPGVHLASLQVGIRSLSKRNAAATSAVVSDVPVAVLSGWPSSSSIPLRHYHQRKVQKCKCVGWGWGFTRSLTQPLNKIHTLLSSIPIPWDAERVTGERPHLPKATHLKRHQKTFFLLRQDPKPPLELSGSPRNTTSEAHTTSKVARTGWWLRASGNKLSKENTISNPSNTLRPCLFVWTKLPNSRRIRLSQIHISQWTSPLIKSSARPGFTLITGEGWEGEGGAMLVDWRRRIRIQGSVP